MDTEIKITCEAKELVDIDKIESIQGELKEFTKEGKKRLRESLINNGIAFPSFVWVNDGKYYSIDGWHRRLIITELKNEGWKVPDKIPVAHIHAKNHAHAKKLLLLSSSQYAKVSNSGFLDFVKDLNLDDIVGDVDIPSIDIDSLLNQLADTNGDDDIPKDVEPITKHGDLWEIGEHRVLCGDSTNPEDVERLMGGRKADMVFTDPPYGVSIGSKNKFLNSHQKSGRNLRPIKNDSMKPPELKKILLQAFTVLKDNCQDYCSYYITSPQGGELGMMMMMLQESGLPVRHVLMWHKNSPTFSMGRLDYDYQHEPILYLWGKKHKFYGKGAQKKSVWSYDKPRACDVHPTMKPVELIENAILNSSEKGNVVIDIFLGSGSTIIACEKTERVCFGMELEPHYCDVIVNRYTEWCVANGKTPIVKLNGKILKA